MFCENLTCAPATLSWLCARQIALVVARCEFWYSLATISAFCAHRIALVVARWEFWHGSRKPSQNFAPVGSLSLWHGATFDVDRATLSALCACRVAQWRGADYRWFCESWPRGLVSSWEGPPITILSPFHGAALEVRDMWRISDVSAWFCTGPYVKFMVLLRTVLMRRPCEEFSDIL